MGREIRSCFHVAAATPGRLQEEAAVTRGQSPTEPAPAPPAALSACARRWLGTVFFPSCVLVCFQMFRAAARGVISGSVSWDLLCCNFSFLRLSPTGQCSFRDKNITSFSPPSKSPDRCPFLRRYLAMFWPVSYKERVGINRYLIKYFFYQ